jgi:hypothetical protein
MAPEFLPHLDQTLELEADIVGTNSPPPKAIGPGRILRRERGSLGTDPLGQRSLRGAARRHRFQSRGPAVVSFPRGRPIHANPLIRIYGTPALFLATLHRGTLIVAHPNERWRTPAMALLCGRCATAPWPDRLATVQSERDGRD